jgi:uncharacterized damage-inducible protein DinB
MHGLKFRELLDYTAIETVRWRAWITKQPPELLELSVGTGRTATVRGLIHHIVVVEIRYTNRLRGEPVVEYDAIRKDPIAATFRHFDEGRVQLEQWLASATDADFARKIQFQTISAGTLEASAHKILAHSLMHGIRHWAQLATSLRQQGHETDWMHDILMSPAIA